MFLCKSLWIINFILPACLCGNDMSNIFLKTFSEGNNFNVSTFDAIYPTIKYNSVKWERNLGFINYSEKCDFIISHTRNFTKRIINVTDSDEISALNDYIYGKFLQSPCSKFKKESYKSQRFNKTEIWLYGFLTVSFINVSAVLGIVFMPLVKKKCYNTLMSFMVSLAVGSLAGTALLILIPDAMMISEMAIHGDFSKHDYKWKATVVFAGFYLFFLTERLFKTVLYTNNEDTNTSITNHCSITLNNATPEGNGVAVKENNHSNNEDVPSSQKIHLNEVTTKSLQKIEPVAWMIIFGDAIHNFMDGLSIGAAFSFDVITGISVSVATMCEELPHELGDFAVLVTSGMTFKQAMFWNTMSAMTCYLGFIIGVIVGEVTSAAQWIFAMAGGLFLYISLVDMMNDIISTLDDMKCSKAKKLTTFAIQNLGLWTGYSIILIVSLYGDQIQFKS